MSTVKHLVASETEKVGCIRDLFDDPRPQKGDIFHCREMSSVIGITPVAGYVGILTIVETVSR